MNPVKTIWFLVLLTVQSLTAVLAAEPTLSADYLVGKREVPTRCE